MLQLPVTNSSKEKFEVNIGLFKTYLAERDYLENVIDNPFKKWNLRDIYRPSSNREKQTIEACPL